MAAVLGLKLDTSAVSRIENPDSGRVIKLDEAAAAAEVLGVPLSALVDSQGASEARLAELGHELERQKGRASEAEWEFSQAQSAMIDIEREIEQLEASRWK